MTIRKLEFLPALGRGQGYLGETQHGDVGLYDEWVRAWGRGECTACAQIFLWGQGPLMSPTLCFILSTPNGNSLSAAELTCGMIICLAR